REQRAAEATVGVPRVAYQHVDTRGVVADRDLARVLGVIRDPVGLQERDRHGVGRGDEPERGIATVEHAAVVRGNALERAWLGAPELAHVRLLEPAMQALAVIARPKLRRALAIAGAAWALALIAVQAFAIGAWCKLCMVADPAAILGAAAVLAGAPAVPVRFALAGLVPAAATLVLA